MSERRGLENNVRASRSLRSSCSPFPANLLAGRTQAMNRRTSRQNDEDNENEGSGKRNERTYGEYGTAVQGHARKY